MLIQFVVSVLQVIIPVAVGVVLAGWLTPIPWKFPNQAKQFVVNKIAGIVVVGGCLTYVGIALSQNFL